MSEKPPGLLARLWLALVCLFRVIADPVFAGGVRRLGQGGEAPTATATATPTSISAALALLALFQREGRLIDFLQQEITSFPDAEVGAAARLVHDGCRKALLAHATVTPVRDEPEESAVTLADDYDKAAVKLTGKVGKPPFRGTLRHAGWRVTQLELPVGLAGHDPEVVAPAEVEL